MTAEELTRALGGRWSGGSGMTICPSHKDGTPSLSIRQGDVAPLLTCHAGCLRQDVIEALRARGLWSAEGTSIGGGAPTGSEREPVNRDDGHLACARRIWSETIPAAGTGAEIYLRSRSITMPPPVWLRFHPSLKHSPTGLQLPAMVAAFQAPDATLCAIQRTYLRQDYSGKAGVLTPKMTLGPVGNGAVRLGEVAPAIGIAEGVESGLSAQQFFNIPVWCRGGSSLAGMWLPDEVIEVQIFGDADDPGRMAAERARDAFEAQGRRVFVRMPPFGRRDWNEFAQAEAASYA